MTSRLSRQIARRVRTLRGERTQREYADDLKVSFQNVSRWEQGVLPSTEMLVRIARRGDVSLDWLVLGKG